MFEGDSKGAFALSGTPFESSSSCLSGMAATIAGEATRETKTSATKMSCIANSFREHPELQKVHSAWVLFSAVVIYSSCALVITNALPIYTDGGAAQSEFSGPEENLIGKRR